MPPGCLARDRSPYTSFDARGRGWFPARMSTTIVCYVNIRWANDERMLLTRVQEVRAALVARNDALPTSLEAGS